MVAGVGGSGVHGWGGEDVAAIIGIVAVVVVFGVVFAARFFGGGVAGLSLLPPRYHFREKDENTASNLGGVLFDDTV